MALIDKYRRKFYNMHICTNMQIDREVIVLDIKLGYYPILDMCLAIRQIYSYERFKPFVESLEEIYSKIPRDVKEKINKSGELTNGWLNLLEELIDLTIKGMVSPEEILLTNNNFIVKASNDYNLTEFHKKEILELFKKLWVDYFSNEVAKNNKSIFARTLNIDSDIESKGLIKYIVEDSDRFQLVNDDTLKVKIKPEHIVNISQLKKVIVMPSVFASRKVTFWNQGDNYLFYISMNSTQEKDIEPSDMLLLKTLALNDKTRLKMLRLLSQSSYSVGDMAIKLNVNPSTVSRHFKVFKDAGYVDVFNQEGNSVYYTLNGEEIKNSLQVIWQFIENNN